MYPQNFYFTKDHEWVSVDGDFAIIGITDFAQKQLGDVVFVELPEVGKQLAVHQTIGSIESVKAVSEVYAPVSGEVVGTNGELGSTPESINQDPHGKGWIVRLKLAHKADLDTLMKASDYERFLEGLAH
jgi:glycine cleavage system H protein